MLNFRQVRKAQVLPLSKKRCCKLFFSFLALSTLLIFEQLTVILHTEQILQMKTKLQFNCNHLNITIQSCPFYWNGICEMADRKFIYISLKQRGGGQGQSRGIRSRKEEAQISLKRLKGCQN